MTGTVYIRAYATNENGTAYGNQITVDYDYLTLPTFTFNGHTYKVAPDPHTTCTEYISWTAANSYCENLTLCGYSDWRMPTVEELETMYQNRVSIGGFIDYSHEDYIYSYYQSSTICGNYHYLINWQTGSRLGGVYQSSAMENYGQYYNDHAHVRPIRIDN